MLSYHTAKQRWLPNGVSGENVRYLDMNPAPEGGQVVRGCI